MMLNNMCKDCVKLNNGCQGTTCQTWTGCALKKSVEQSKKEFKAALKQLEAAEEAANKAEAAYEAEPEDAEKEEAFDTAYKAEFTEFIMVSELLVEMTNGRIGEKIAREMVRTKRDEILNLLA